MFDLLGRLLPALGVGLVQTVCALARSRGDEISRLVGIGVFFEMGIDECGCEIGRGRELKIYRLPVAFTEQPELARRQLPELLGREPKMNPGRTPEQAPV